jgi:hypothetical protein
VYTSHTPQTGLIVRWSHESMPGVT